MRIVLALVLLARVAAADTSPATKAKGPTLDLTNAARDDAAFRAWVKKRIATQGGTLSSWGWLQLDDDAAPERFAVVCKPGDSTAGEWILVEDTPGRRWALERETDGRNECTARKSPKWEREPSSTYVLTNNVHHGNYDTHVALRKGEPAVVRTTSNEIEVSKDATYGTEEDVDYDALEQSRETWVRVGDAEAVTNKKVVRAALFAIDGASGAYRRALAGNVDAVTAFEVAVRRAGKRLRVGVTAARPLRVGEAFEVWTTGSAGRPLAWTFAWDGARWQAKGLKRAPKELPEVEGDARALAMHVVTREDDTRLTVVAVSADGATRVATSDLDPEVATSLGRATSGPPSADAKPEPER